MSDPKEELILKPFERLSVSKLDTWEMCPRHYHYQFAYGLLEVVTPKQQQNRTLGEQLDAQVEAWVKGTLKDVAGATAAVSRHYPTPGQSCVDVQRWVRGDWAGAPWVGKIDLLTGPSTVWGPLNRPQKHGLVRVTDLKSTSDLKWAKDATQIDRNRQLHMYASGVYRERGRPIPNLFEVSQVVVERGAPHRAQSIVRVSGEKQLLELEEGDHHLVRSLIASHGEEDTLALDPAGDLGVCERWYGYRCAFYERCHGKSRVAVPQSLGALMDAEAGRGSGGVGRTIDEIAAKLPGIVSAVSGIPEKFITGEESAMLSTPDAARHQNAKIEGENAKYRKRTLHQGKSYVAVQGDRHGRTWEFRMLGDNWVIRVADKPGPVEATPGFFPVDTTDESAKGTVPTGTGAKMDIIQLRAIFSPFLLSWDERVEAEKPKQLQTQTSSEEDDIFGQAEKRVEEQSGTQAPDESRVKELTSVGLTDAQARSLADGGVALDALRAGTVTVADLTRCKGIGKGGAEKILSRFATTATTKKVEPEVNVVVKDEAIRDEEKIARVTHGQEEKPSADTYREILGMLGQGRERIAELEGQLTAARLRIADLESRPQVQSASRDGFTIYVGCRPDAEVKGFLDVIAPYLERIAKAKKVADVSIIDPGYTVPGLLSEALHADPPAPCAFTVSERDQVWGWVRRYFLSRASEIVVASVVP